MGMMQMVVASQATSSRERQTMRLAKVSRVEGTPRLMVQVAGAGGSSLLETSLGLYGGLGGRDEEEEDDTKEKNRLAL